MPGKLRHIAISVPDPWAVAPFYEQAFGMRRLGETDSSLARGVYLSDGCITLALLNFKDDHHAGPLGRKHVGLHHIGFWVDDIKESLQSLEAAGGRYFLGEVPVKGNTFYEVKYFDPNGVMVDVTEKGWGGALKNVVAADDTKSPQLRHPALKADRNFS
jgi:catechol 2,3-dioxygenase-like lactoylglutathione lyase family enzyme